MVEETLGNGSGEGERREQACNDNVSRRAQEIETGQHRKLCCNLPVEVPGDWAEGDREGVGVGGR